MIHILQSFGCGLSFAIGAGFGIFVTCLAMASIRKQDRERNNNHLEVTEKLLAERNVVNARCADSLERIEMLMQQK